MRSVRVFVSSPGDTHFERMRVERVVERLNGEFSGIAKLEAIRWEGKYYRARATFQQQIPEAAECELVIAILRHRLGTEFPDDFPTMPNGERYPSGTAYEILSAIEASKVKSVPDVYVFRYSDPPTVKLDDEATNELVSEQWNRLNNMQGEREVMVSLNKVGDMRFDLNDMSGTLANYDEGLTISRKLVELDASNPKVLQDLAYSLEKSGDARLKLNDAKGALAVFEEALALRKKVSESNKANHQYRRDMTFTLDRISNAKLGLQDIAGGLAAAEESLAVARDLQILARLDADGKLNDEQKGWSESFLTLRQGSQ